MDTFLVTFLVLDGQQIMATGGLNGDIALWNLDERRLSYVMKGVHNGEVISAQFLNGQPIMITSGNDNSLKVNDIFSLSLSLSLYIYICIYFITRFCKL